MTENAELIHEASLRLLAEVGLTLHHPEALRLCARHGMEVLGATVRFRPAALMELIRGAPAAFTLHARDPRHDIQFGQGQVNFAPGYGAPSILEADGRLRTALFADYKCFLRLCEASDCFDINGGILVQPSDLAPEPAMPMMVAATLVGSQKCLLAPNGDQGGTDLMFKMLEALFGPDDLRHNPRVITLVSTLSPLQMDHAALNTLLTYARFNQPVMVTPTVMAGTTGPVTLAGTTVLGNAEALAGIALTQMASPGCPVVYGCQNTGADMRTGGISIGSPERTLCVALGAEMAHFYGLPFRGGGSDSDAHGFNAQAGLEGMLTLLNSWRCGTDLILHAAGILAGYAAMGYEKFILDLEMIRLLRRLERGVVFRAEDLALEVIAQAGIGGQFLTARHTFENCRRELFSPAVCKRGALTGGDATAELIAAARREKQKLLECYTQPILDEGQTAALSGIMAAAGMDLKACLPC